MQGWADRRVRRRAQAQHGAMRARGWEAAGGAARARGEVSATRAHAGTGDAGVRPSKRQFPSPALVAGGPLDELAKAPTSIALRNAEIVRAQTAGMTLAAIAAEHRLSRSRVRQIVTQAADE